MSRNGLVSSFVRASLGALVLSFAASPHASAQIIGPGFDGCGIMVEGVECPLFLADSGGLFILLGVPGVQVGDRLQVTGMIDPNCISFCQQGGGCLTASSFGECETGTRSCAGDGGDQAGCTDCPCGNNAPQGSPGGCLNGASGSAELIGSGIDSVFLDTLRFEVRGGNPGTFGVLISADNLLPQNPMNPCPAGSGVQTISADGLRCVGGNVLRHGARAMDAAGDIGLTNAGWGGNDPPAQGLIGQYGFSAGQTRSWQVFYREQAGLVCQSGQNTTNAVSTTFSSLVVGGLPF